MIPWFISIVFITAIIGLGSIVILIAAPTFAVEFHLELYHILIFIGLGSAALMELILTLWMYQDDRFMVVINELFIVHQRCLQARRNLTRNPPIISPNSSQNDKLSYTIYAIVILTGVWGPIAALGGVAANMDPFYFIFDKYFLPSAFERTISCILISSFMRYFLALLCTVEFIRFMTFAMFVIMLTLISLNYMLWEILLTRNNHEALKFYRMIRIGMGAVDRNLSKVLLILVFFSQIITVIGFWIAIKGSKFAPLLITMTGLCLAVVFVIGEALMFSGAAKLRNQSVAVLNRNKNKYFTPNLRGIHHGSYAAWAAQRTLGFHCGNLYIFSYSSCSNFLLQLMKNLADAVILFEP
ncbi:unnamed protein product [Orchesella dallaii]|uniref:Odorant receptor n=1 Tax=Orchesella dallaii TaxID=48710 RepID=A0ABP1PUV4_9HEXA